MGTVYSISRIRTFDDCRLRYRYRYIEAIDAAKETVEAFMGSRVHEALQELYGFIKNGVVKPLDWLLGIYEDLWDKNMSPAVKVVRSEYTLDDYRRKGRKCLEEYYRTYAPFDRTKTVDIEKKLMFKVRAGEEEVAFLGYIDRLDWNVAEGTFEIHDYKTSGNLPSQREADSDEQLGLYEMAVREEWPDANSVRLVWHYLVFNKELVSSRNPADLETLAKEIIRRVREIEACVNFDPRRSPLCDWCDYQDICPEWKHPLEMKTLPVNEYLKDEGVVLVSKYAELEDRKKALNDEIAAVETEEAAVAEAAFAFGAARGVRVIDGPGHQLVLSEKAEIAAPLKKDNPIQWEALRRTLIEEKKYEDVSTINNYMLTSRMRSWPEQLVRRVGEFLISRITKSVYLRKKG